MNLGHDRSYNQLALFAREWKGELPGLRRPQGLAAIASGRLDVAHYTVVRPMRSMGLQDVIRSKPIRTTFSDKTTVRPAIAT